MGSLQGELFSTVSPLDSQERGHYVGRHDRNPASRTHRPLISAFLKRCSPPEHGSAARITRLVMGAFWESLVDERTRREGSDVTTASPAQRKLRPFLGDPLGIDKPIPPVLQAHAERIGRQLARLDVLEAGYWIGMIYTALLPKEVRAALGVYYTPPVLTERLLDLSEEAGVDWRRARVLDPACGGGAFIAPVARRIRMSAGAESAKDHVEMVARQVRGFEIDPFGAWLSQVLLDAEMLEASWHAGERLPVCIEVLDTLALDAEDHGYDLIIGNPPYGRTKLDAESREKYARSLYGHANLYGLFTDQALRLAKADGVVSFITPTSFLAGQYFKELRSLIANTAPAVSIDFINARSGVFEDVLQETALVVFRRGAKPTLSPVHSLEISTEADAGLRIERAGDFTVPADPSAPWIIPRDPAAGQLAAGLKALPHRLGDYGYRVKTGPLVWNRYKDQLRDGPGPDRYPIIWAEAVGPDGSFTFRAEKRNHRAFMEARPGDEWLLARTGCVLLQRTTAKEQRRRLVAARIPDAFVAEHGAVVVENHLNMLVATEPERITPATERVLTALLNSAVVDRAFRCMNGSVAVSAFELEALPLPGPDALEQIAYGLAEDAPAEEIEELIEQSYFDAGAAESTALARDSAAA